MNNMNAFLSLVDHGYSLDPQIQKTQQANPKIALQHLLNYVLEHDILSCKNSWRLDQQVCRELELRSGIRPAGGWRELCSLAAGARFLRALSDGFVPDTITHVLSQDDIATIRTKLLESFTIHLAPPSAAASLFLLMDIHPIWGLRLAHTSNNYMQKTAKSMRFGERDETIFPQSVLEILQKAVYGMIACTIATLRKLDPNQTYSLNAFTNFVDAVSQFCRRQAEADLKRNAIDSLPVFLPSEFYPDGTRPLSHHRTIEFSVKSFVEQIFIPANTMHRFDDGTFAIHQGAFDTVLVDTLDSKEQNHWLSKFLNDTIHHHVV